MDPETLVNMVLVALPDDRMPTEEEIRDKVDRLVEAFGVDGPVRAEVLQRVMARRLVRMDTGFALVERDHTPWVHARRPEIDPYYWSRYKIWLQRQGWPPGVLTGLDRTTDEILDLIGDPKEAETWKRRGLVMGDVQSGKTATYSALICKAADAGYRFIILLTGTIENLRRQTQERLDSGFVGFDSSEHLKRNRQDVTIGVGRINGQRQATVFTSSAADFRSATLDALGLSLTALREPALVVIKKHTKILENLRDWVVQYNTTHSGIVDIPILMIDDEADNASINTNDPGKDPTRVNSGIRELLKLFRRTTYVGFTATPFANIFVNPDSQEQMLGDDLFPRDFIYTLQAPTNYFGTQRIFLEDSGSQLHLRRMEDVETVIPARHRSSLQVPGLPASLLEALCVFLVSNAIRDLRSEGPTHRSMLVNVSQFTNVQDQVEELLHAELERIQTAIRNFSSLPVAEAMADDSIQALHAAWQAEYSDREFTWDAILPTLRNAALPVLTVAVNQRTGPKALDYRAYKDTGLRVVAVGGNSLSRGLTLEGLTVSYFRRTSQMYDTLLQMGRWFGYRPGYEDLCRVWLPQEAIDWYGHISLATEELRDDLKQMYRLRRTPKDFGLKVRAHPESLLVTARNKMRTAKEVTRVISVSEQSFESVELPASVSDLSDNWQRVVAFVKAMENAGTELPEDLKSPRRFGGVKRKEVAAFLRGFRVTPTEFRFQPGAIADLLDETRDAVLDEWDVVIPGGEGKPIQLGSKSLKMQMRKLRRGAPPDVLTVSGQKRRVGSRGVEKSGLTPEQVKMAEAAALQAARDATKKGEKAPDRVNVADRFYRKVRTRPLLLIHVIQGEPDPADTKLPELTGDTQYAAIGLSLPPLESRADDVKYKINLVKAREVFGISDDLDDDEEDEVVEVTP